jgi:hypothetical protein
LYARVGGGRRQAFPPVLDNVFLFLCHSDSGSPKSSWGGQNVNRLLSRSFAFTFFFQITRDQRRAPTSLLVMNISPVTFEQSTTFPHIPSVYYTLIMHFANLSISAGRNFFASGNHIIYRRTSRVAGFSVFVYICNYCSELRKKIATCVPLDLQKTTAPPSQEVRASPARPLLTIVSYFWTHLVPVY